MAQPPLTACHAADTSSLEPAFLNELRAFLDRAFDGEFSDEDWQHTLGGTHVWRTLPSGELVSHGSLVTRRIRVGPHHLQVGYLEAIATAHAARGRGHGSAVLGRLGERVRERFPLGVLSTGSHAFYERHGWERWRGRTGLDGPRGVEWTPEDDDSVMILRTPRSPAIDLAGDLLADWRCGDIW